MKKLRMQGMAEKSSLKGVVFLHYTIWTRTRLHIRHTLMLKVESMSKHKFVLCLWDFYLKSTLTYF